MLKLVQHTPCLVHDKDRKLAQNKKIRDIFVEDSRSEAKLLRTTPAGNITSTPRCIYINIEDIFTVRLLITLLGGKTTARAVGSAVGSAVLSHNRTGISLG